MTAPPRPPRAVRRLARRIAESCMLLATDGTLQRVRAPAALAALCRLCERILCAAGRPVAVAISLAEARALAGPPPPIARAAALVGTLDPAGAVAFSTLWLPVPLAEPELEAILARELPPCLRRLAAIPGFPAAGRA
ncbi:MAG: hypothetical protein WHV64_18160 [Geminicoccaceae bacterium]